MLRTSARRLALVVVFALGCEGSAPRPTAGSASASSAPADAERPPGPWADVASAAASASEAQPPGPPPREIAGAEHILIAYKGAQGAPKRVLRSKEAAKKRAEAALAKLVGGKATFVELVQEFSDDEQSKATAGKLGNFERNAMPGPFSDVAFSLKVGDFSGVVESPRGFHIIHRTQ
jgi:peptidyl-prolyl cis-trans isomerase NIMA-interacting 1